MSVVTTALVLASYVSPETGLALEEGFQPEGARLTYFNELTKYPDTADMWAGGKVPESEVWGGAFNHLDADSVVEWLKSLDWGSKSNGVLFAWHTQVDGCENWQTVVIKEGVYEY